VLNVEARRPGYKFNQVHGLFHDRLLSYTIDIRVWCQEIIELKEEEKGRGMGKRYEAERRGQEKTESVGKEWCE